MIEKTLTLDELKQYETRHGFVFAGVTRSSDRAIENLAHSIKNAKFSDDLPEFYSRIGENVVAFVYPEGCHFESGTFYHISKKMEFLQLFQIEMLGYFIKNNL